MPSEPFLPTRLIEITTEGAEVKARLHETLHDVGSPVYMTLSHCWESGAVWKLLRATYRAALESLPMRDLPPVFMDAISVASSAGINFLWIDSVCIVQDDVDDWSKESARTGDIYGGAICNVAATGFTDGSHGLFAARNTQTLGPIAVKLDFPIIFNEYDGIIETEFYLVDRDVWVRGVDRAPLNKRSWVVQERYLSPRIIHFGRQQLFWECCELTASETFPHGLPSRLLIRSAPSVLLNAIYSGKKAIDEASLSEDDFIDWWTIVSAYSLGRLTFATDKLVAISGMARSFQSFSRSRYLAGLWERNLPHDLL
ncbi:hypothetical protein PV08_06334 [Exophiala spinifera]|uniref:Heterokaryon incompatibility domain-containing protein n=1 Tax=Exophiala spinifera TaxID=91928 RepID=A0A0D2BB89_9EURO|nr:uncharacterized protein PV08_06334 [Exophiala spinifera]KIW16283.1 hypothetical protein PV08_06334 [Exophiala spinifera]